MELLPAGESSFILYPRAADIDQVSDHDASWVMWANTTLRAALAHVVVDTVPSYGSLLLIYDPWQTDHAAVETAIREALAEPPILAEQQGRLVTLPVYYDIEVGPDLPHIAAQANLSIEQVVECHHSSQYRVYAIGFAPGFGFMGNIDPTLALPRKATPTPVAKGSVAIAERQTAIYPRASPGGWHVIGRCPLDLFSPQHQSPMLFAVGDRIEFVPLTREQFLQQGGVL